MRLKSLVVPKTTESLKKKIIGGSMSKGHRSQLKAHPMTKAGRFKQQNTVAFRKFKIITESLKSIFILYTGVNK